jgi:hypothetical protein
VYSYGTKIFPYKHTLPDYVFLIKKTVNYYVFDFFGKDKEEKSKEKNTFFSKLPTLSRSSSPMKQMDGSTPSPHTPSRASAEINRTEELEKLLETMRTSR